MAAKAPRNASESLYLASMTRKYVTTRQARTPNATNAPNDTKNDPKQSPTGPSEGPEHAKKSQKRAPKGLREDQKWSKTELKEASERLE